jgi:uncharacterized membrane protein
MPQVDLGNVALHCQMIHNLYRHGLVIVGLINFLSGW